MALKEKLGRKFHQTNAPFYFSYLSTVRCCFCLLPSDLFTQSTFCPIRYHHWNHCCVKISRDVLRQEQTTESLATSTATDLQWRHHQITQEYAIVQIPWLYRLNQLRRQPQTARLRRRALTMIQSSTDQIRRKETCFALIAALNFPIKRSTSYTKDVIVNQTRGSVTSARKHVTTFMNSIRICWVKVINENTDKPNLVDFISKILFVLLSSLLDDVTLIWVFSCVIDQSEV